MKIVYCILLSFVLFACDSRKMIDENKQNDQNSVPKLQASIAGIWKLQKSKQTFSERIQNNANIQFTIAETNVVSGTTGCNSYQNTFERIDDTLSFGEHFSMTKMLCNDAKDERLFLEELKKCTIATIENNELKMYQNSDLLLTFVKVE